ncbi:MAG TPA: DUF4234 domain-containing protein [Pseudonocardiaceae bacterium]
MWLGLTIITLGIYHLVWYFKIHKELADFDRRRTIPTTGSPYYQNQLNLIIDRYQAPEGTQIPLYA